MKKINILKMLQFLLGLILLSIVALLVIDVFQSSKTDGKAIEIVLIIFFFLSFFLLGLIVFAFYWMRWKTTNSIISSLNSIDSSQEEFFNVGSIIYNDDGKISFISPWLLKEGMNKFLGTKVKNIGINIESTKIQKWNYENHDWEVLSSKEDKSILLRDVTHNELLKDIIIKSQLCSISLHVSYSKKINFNDSWKSEASLKIEQTLQEWANKVNGTFYHLKLIDNTYNIYFRWEEGEKDIRDEIFFNSLKSSISKFLNDITISAGASFGKGNILDLKDKSLKALEISKNRGGDQLVLENALGEIEYLGESSIHTQSNTSQALRIFYSNLVDDIKNSKEVFITSHKLADLDSIGSTLGMYEFTKTLGKTAYIILDKLGSTATDLYNKLPRSLKDKFITEVEARKLLSNRSRIIIMDTSVASITQASSIIRKLQSEKITIIDHHRVGEDTYKSLGERTFIDTASSSASEIVVEMMNLFLTKDNRSKINSFVATSLLAGIKLDTKGLTKNTSDSTHNSILFLLNNDADTNMVNELFLLPTSFLSVKNDALKNIKTIRAKFLFTALPKKNIIDDEVVAILADDFLNYKKIEASFVLARTSDNKYKLSIRSNGKVNAQLIAESLGGGGHFNSAAASWPIVIDYENIIKKITKQINGDIQ